MMKQQYPAQFFQAASNGCTSTVKAFIDAGFDINIERDGKSALYLAACKKKWEMVKILIEAGANVNFVNRTGWTPLYYAARDGPTDIVKAFIDAGVDVNIERGGKSALNLAACQKKWEIVKILIGAGAKVNFVDRTGWTPLYFAARDGPNDIVKAFIDAGVDVNIERGGKSALNFAAWKNKWKMVKILIEAGANVNFVDWTGWTPLYYAAKDGPADIVKAFIDAGVDVNIEIDGRSALDLAARQKKWENVKILVGTGANVNFINKNKWTPIYYAARDGQHDVILLFIKAGANLNMYDKKGYNPIELASSPKSCKILMKYGLLKHSSILLHHPINTELSKFWRECEKQIENMKQMKMKSGVSIYEYLMETDENKLAFYLSDENSRLKNISVAEKSKYHENFFVYIEDIEAQLNRGRQRAYLLYKTANCFSKKMPEDIRWKISELLANDDLKNFLNCMKMITNSEISLPDISVFIGDLKVSSIDFSKKDCISDETLRARKRKFDDLL